MSYKIVLLATTVIASFGLGHFSGKCSMSVLYRAFVNHRRVEREAFHDQATSDTFLKYEERTKKCPLVGAVISVEISRTIDDSEYVVTLRGPDASQQLGTLPIVDTCSLWVRGVSEQTVLHVRDVSPY